MPSRAPHLRALYAVAICLADGWVMFLFGVGARWTAALTSGAVLPEDYRRGFCHRRGIQMPLTERPKATSACRVGQLWVSQAGDFALGFGDFR